MSSFESKFVLNKIFTGSYLENNLGHELKNFITLDDGTKIGFVNPHGKCSNKNIEYIIHLIDSKSIGKNIFEIVGISKIINKSVDDEFYLSKTFCGVELKNIFEGYWDKKFKNVTFEVEKYFELKENKNIYIEIGGNESKVLKKDKNLWHISFNQRFGQSEGMHIFPKTYENENIIQLIFDEFNEWFVEKNHRIDFDEYHNELPFCFITDRVHLETSMSNMITYFLNRDKKFLKKFLIDFLKIKIDKDENFEVSKEKNNIDIEIKSNKRVIVIENKINSDINGIKGFNYSQLSKYYELVQKLYPNHTKHFFILMPKYNNLIDINKIKKYKWSEQYIVKNYDDLYLSLVKNYEYGTNSYQNFIFNEFKTHVMYLTLTKAKQIQYTSFIKLKQIIEEFKK